MTINYRIRNLVIASALAAAAVLLTVLYVSTSRTHDKTQAQGVTVYVAKHSYAPGTPGSKIADNVTQLTVERSAVVADAVTNPEQIRTMYTTTPVYAGEQLTLKRFAPPSEQGVLAQLTGTQRAFQVSGDATQLLSGTLVAGDTIDVVANMKDPKDNTNIKALVALRGLRVPRCRRRQARLQARRLLGPGHTVLLGVTDEQAQRLEYITQNGNWALELRPVKKPVDSKRSFANLSTVLGGRS